MFSTLIRSFAFATALLAGAATAPALAQVAEPVPVQDYDVFVDLPTAFAFIKLPTGWKFIGKLDAAQLSRLPPGTLTSLLPTEAAETRLASEIKARASQPSL